MRVLDGIFGEDAHRARSGHAAANLGVLRQLALSLLRHTPALKGDEFEGQAQAGGLGCVRMFQAEPDTIPRQGWSTGKRKKIGTLKEFLEVFPEFEDVIVDSTEQERAQPKKTKK